MKRLHPHKYLYFLFLLSSVLIFWVGCKNNDVKPTDQSKTMPYVFSGIPYSAEGMPTIDQFIPADNPVTQQGVKLGRMLFYDSSLSKDNTIACASCHHQGYAFTDRGRPLSFGVNDSIGTFNSMALFNLAWERGGFFWDGRAHTLELQAEGPVPNTREMDLPWDDAVKKLQANPIYPPLFKDAFGTTTITKENTTQAIAQFVRTILSFHSKYDSVQEHLAQFTESEQRGYNLFTSDPSFNDNPNNHTVPLGHRLPKTGLDCFHCHAPPFFTPENLIPTSEVLMNDGVGTINVKVPSLRNLKFSAPYMHNGSMPNLDSVLAHYDHEVDPNDPYLNKRMYAVLYTDPNSSNQSVTPHMDLTPQDVADLKAFLNTLNDYSLLTNKDYSNPFVH